jgi:hypothetical protein
MGRRSKEQGIVDRFMVLRAQGKRYEGISKELGVGATSSSVRHAKE